MGIQVFCPLEEIRLQPSDQAEALQPDSCVQNQNRRKQDSIGGVKSGKGEGRRGKRSTRSSVPHPVTPLWPAVCVSRRAETNGAQLGLLRLVCLQANWSPSTLNGQDVSHNKEEVPLELPFVAGSGLEWTLVQHLEMNCLRRRTC